MHASCEPRFRSTRREGLFSCKTEESEVAEPRTTVQSWSGLWKDDWNKGVEARASAAKSRLHARQGTCHFLGKLTGESKVRDAGLLPDISIVTPSGARYCITARERSADLCFVGSAAFSFEIAFVFSDLMGFVLSMRNPWAGRKAKEKIRHPLKADLSAPPWRASRTSLRRQSE